MKPVNKVPIVAAATTVEVRSEEVIPNAWEVRVQGIYRSSRCVTSGTVSDRSETCLCGLDIEILSIWEMGRDIKFNARIASSLAKISKLRVRSSPFIRRTRPIVFQKSLFASSDKVDYVGGRKEQGVLTAEEQSLATPWIEDCQ